MSFSQASPFQPVTQDPPGELGRGRSRGSFLSPAHTEIPRRQPHAAARGEPCTCSQCSQRSHTPTENLLSQATDPRPGLVSSHLLRELHPAHPNPQGARPPAKEVLVIQHSHGIDHLGKEKRISTCSILVPNAPFR